MLIQITNTCGMNCPHCMQNSTIDPQHMSDQTVDAFLEMLRDIHVVWSCTSKQAYDTDWQAKVATDELSNQHHKPFRWYRCKYCGKFHVTHS